MPTPAKPEAAPVGNDTFTRRQASIARLSAAAAERTEPQPPVKNFTAPDGFVDIADLAGLTRQQNDPSVVTLLDGAPARKRDLGSDVCPIRATYPMPALSHDLLPCVAVEAITSEAVEFSSTKPNLTTVRLELVRKPGGSKASLQGGRLCCDVPGAYLLEATMGGGWVREITIAAFPASAEDQMVYPPHMRLQRRLRLRAIVRDAAVTPQTIVAGLELGPTDFRALLGMTVGTFNPTQYG
jgi:hypothetical protein